MAQDEDAFSEEVTPFRPYYRRTMKELQAGVARNHQYAAQLQADAEKAQAEIDAIEDREKPCLFCGGKMFDISSVAQINVFVDGHPATTLEHNRHSYGMRVPESWECQSCHAFETGPPSEDAMIWAAEGISPKSKALAALVFDRLSIVNTVAYENTGPAVYTPGWLFKVENTWYFLEGDKARIMNSLGIRG